MLFEPDVVALLHFDAAVGVSALAMARKLASDDEHERDEKRFADPSPHDHIKRVTVWPDCNHVQRAVTLLFLVTPGHTVTRLMWTQQFVSLT